MRSEKHGAEIYRLKHDVHESTFLGIMKFILRKNNRTLLLSLKISRVAIGNLEKQQYSLVQVEVASSEAAFSPST